MSSKSRTLLKRRVASAAVVLSALVAGAPVAQASADTTPAFPLSSWSSWPGLTAFNGVSGYPSGPISFQGPSVGEISVTIGPTVIGNVFNGGTTICTTDHASQCIVATSP